MGVVHLPKVCISKSLVALIHATLPTGCSSVTDLLDLICLPESQVRSQLAASEATAASLKAELLKAESQAREAGSLQQAMEQAEQGRRALAQDWQEEQALLEKQLQAAGRNRDQLAEQVLFSDVFM